MKYKEIEVSKISTLYNSRSTIEKDDLASLMQNIKENGLLQPIGVIEKKDKYELIFGNRRLLAFKKLGKSIIPAIVSDVEISEDDAILKNAAENIVRKGISPIELGKLSLDLKEKFAMSNGEIAAALSLPKTRIKHAIDIIRRTPKETQKLIGYYNTGASNMNKNGKISVSVINTIYSSRLTKEQANELVEYCKKSEANSLKVSQMIKFIKNGMSVKDAIEHIENFYFISIDFIANKKELDEVKKVEKSIVKYISLIVNGKRPAHPNLFLINES